MTDLVDVVTEACACVLDDRPEAAAAVLERHYPLSLRRPRPALARRSVEPFAGSAPAGRARTLGSRTKLRVLQRDGFTCRYSGERLVHPVALFILSDALETLRAGRPHPFGQQKLSEGGHPAHVDLFPAVDHVVPLARGGSDEMDNLATASWFVNLAKRDRTLDEFANLALRAPPTSAALWDGLSAWAVTMLERFPGRFDVGRNATHARDLITSWRPEAA